MPLSGGATDKIGNRFEGLWTVNKLYEVMDEQIDSIRLEPPGKDGEGIEFWVTSKSGFEYYQVKRQFTKEGRWSISDLNSKGILGNLFSRLSDPTAKSYFVSTQSAWQLFELSERARSAKDWPEFENVFLNTPPHQAAFEQLCNYLGNVNENVYNLLKRINIITIDEVTLRLTVKSRLETIIDGNSDNVLDVLAQFILGKIHQELRAVDIYNHLDSRGYQRRLWNNDPHLCSKLATINQSFISSYEENSITQTPFVREEVEAITRTLIDKENNVIVYGEAGVGKSGAIYQTIKALQSKQIPYLIFRIDRLEPTYLPEEVGKQIGLPGSPVSVLAAISKNKKCVLIMDQLDAISLSSGRNPGFFDTISLMIKQSLSFPNLKLLLVCRKFDLENDYRLRKLKDITDSIEIRRLSDIVIKRIIGDLGFDSSKLTKKQIELFAIPLHLKLLQEVSLNDQIDLLSLNTVNALYDRFWDYKQEITQRKLDCGLQWLKVIDIMCSYMNDNQILSVPENILDSVLTDVKAMASEHVLICDNKRFAFFHEGFFDYSYARRFTAKNGNLIELITKEKQQLFHRAQVRQILMHSRNFNWNLYIKDLKYLLNSPKIRFHLKQVVFALLSNLEEPKQEEWDILNQLLKTNKTNEWLKKLNQNFLVKKHVLYMEAVQNQIWSSIGRSESWFKLLNSNGVIKQFLSSNLDEDINKIIFWLSIMQPHLAGEVFELIEDYTEISDEKWDKRIRFLFQKANLASDRRFFDLFLKLIMEGKLDGIGDRFATNGDFWTLLYSLSEDNAQWACEAIGSYLKRGLEICLENEDKNPFSKAIPDSQFSNKVIMDCAENAPEELVEQLLPFIIRVISFIQGGEKHDFFEDPLWRYRSVNEAYSLKDNLLLGMEVALRNLSLKDPEVFVKYKIRIRECKFETIQFLLIRSFSVNGETFGDEAIDYLCEDLKRFSVGYYDNPQWASRELITNSTPYCSEEKLTKLENILLDFYPDWERTIEGSKVRGYSQFVLMDGIIDSRRSTAVKKRLEELNRKFKQKPTPPSTIEISRVESPIRKESAEKMTDEQWLSAINKHSKSDGNADFLKGGAYQLSSVLEELVKKEPNRFAHLVECFNNNVNVNYFDAVLRGIMESDLDVEASIQVCLRCHRIPNNPCGRWICKLISKHVKDTIPNQALDLVNWYALNDPDPQDDTRLHDKRDPFEAGLNSNRGSAALAIGDLICQGGALLPRFLPTIKILIDDPTITVKACVVYILLAIFKYDKNLAVELFTELFEKTELFYSSYVEQFIRHAIPTKFDELLPILQKMLSSNQADIVEAASRQLTIAALIHQEAKFYLNRVISGTNDQRIGSAKILSANLANAEHRKTCKKALIKLFTDKNENVRKEASKCFDDLDGDLAPYLDLIMAFLRSKSFCENRSFLLRLLLNSTNQLTDIAILTAKRFLEMVGFEAGDIRTHTAFEADEVSKLIIRVYNQAKDIKLREESLDLIDHMCQLQVYGLNEALSQYER